MAGVTDEISDRFCYHWLF